MHHMPEPVTPIETSEGQIARLTFELLTRTVGQTVVSESGIHTRADVEELEQVGVDAVLVGEALMRAPDPEAACRDLAREEEPTQA
jgi:indole-3-glycerol phosphate synthase